MMRRLHGWPLTVRGEVQRREIGQPLPPIGEFAFEDLPPMWMDHKEIVLEARRRLKEDIQEEHLTHMLLPKRFTMPELHQLHQAIMEEKIDRSRFQKKMLATGIYQRLPKLQKETPGRNPFQYTLKSRNQDNSQR